MTTIDDGFSGYAGVTETTEGRVGFVHPYAGVADVETSSVKVLLRDFEHLRFFQFKFARLMAYPSASAEMFIKSAILRRVNELEVVGAANYRAKTHTPRPFEMKEIFPNSIHQSRKLATENCPWEQQCASKMIRFVLKSLVLFP